MADKPDRWTDAEVEEVGKKELVDHLQAHATLELLQAHKVHGQAKAIAKSRKKDELVACYKEMVEKKAWCSQAEKEEALMALELEKKAKLEAKQEAEAAAAESSSSAADKKDVKYFDKNILKKGDKINFVKKGETIKIEYWGCIHDGTPEGGMVFDSSYNKKKKKQEPLRVKVGTGAMIKGLDEALVGMCLHEKAEVIIPPEHAYGKEGHSGAKIPPNSTLKFEVTVVEVGL